jgi:hypothetical protein
MKKVLITVVIFGTFIVRADAAEDDMKREAGQGFEQRKIEIAQHIDKRITNSQAEKACVQAAESHVDLKACREKYRPHKMHDENRHVKQQ